MADTQKSAGNSKKRVEEGVEPSYREVANAAPCGPNQLRRSDGHSTVPRDIKKDACGIARSYKPSRSRKTDNKSDSLSDIDDAEVSGYLNTKEETNFKRILWEAMNGNYTKAKKQKPTTETKKGVSVKKAAKTTGKPEIKRRSSRINYDALKNLNIELEQSSDSAKITGAASYAHSTVNSPHGDISHYREDNESSGHHEGGMYYEDGDEHFDDELFDF